MEFIRLPTFERTAAGLFSERDLLELELALIANPRAGAVIPSGRGLRKLRRPLSGRGKRGGARVIYYQVSAEDIIYLVFAYAKSQREDLDHDQLQQLAQLIDEP